MTPDPASAVLGAKPEMDVLCLQAGRLRSGHYIGTGGCVVGEFSKVTHNEVRVGDKETVFVVRAVGRGKNEATAEWRGTIRDRTIEGEFVILVPNPRPPAESYRTARRKLWRERYAQRLYYVDGELVNLKPVREAFEAEAGGLWHRVYLRQHNLRYRFRGELREPADNVLRIGASRRFGALAMREV
jgi:hypothetical protein